MDKRRILIVDANEELRALLSDVLTGFGHEVVATGDRDEALERDDLEDFDLIISDLTDDVAGGVQIVGELKRKSLLVPVVVASEAGQPHGVVRAFKFGESTFLLRPYD